MYKPRIESDYSVEGHRRDHLRNQDVALNLCLFKPVLPDLIEADERQRMERARGRK